MSTEISKNLMCVLLRQGVEIWLDNERAEKLEEAMETQKYLRLEGSIIATSEIAGVFTPAHMEEYTRRKNGQWRCDKGTWHDRGRKCECRRVLGEREYRLPDGRIVTTPIYDDAKR